MDLLLSTTSGRARSRVWPSGPIYALIALGYTLVYGVLRLINFAHSEVFMCGTLRRRRGRSLAARRRHAATGPRLIVVLLLVALRRGHGGLGGAWRCSLERVAYRPLRRRNAPPLIALISAIGASLRPGRGDGPARQDRQAGSASTTTCTDYVERAA